MSNNPIRALSRVNKYFLSLALLLLSGCQAMINEPIPGSDLPSSYQAGQDCWKQGSDTDLLFYIETHIGEQVNIHSTISSLDSESFQIAGDSITVIPDNAAWLKGLKVGKKVFLTGIVTDPNTIDLISLNNGKSEEDAADFF